MHTAWAGTVGGRLKTDYRYSAVLCYNAFPVPPLSDDHRARLTAHTFAVLEARERHADHKLGDLYLPDKMPPDLRRAHEGLDEMVDDLYGAATPPSDTERLAMLFGLYEELTSAEAVAA
jgi:hypothetical protein